MLTRKMIRDAALEFRRMGRDERQALLDRAVSRSGSITFFPGELVADDVALIDYGIELSYEMVVNIPEKGFSEWDGNAA